MTNEFNSPATRRTLRVNDKTYAYYSLRAAQDAGIGNLQALPYTIKVVLENQLRQQATGASNGDDLTAFMHRMHCPHSDCEIGFRPARMMMAHTWI